ncbi:MAG: hypothetical protein WDO15_29835 [Bacteroidota bacterium]
MISFRANNFGGGIANEIESLAEVNARNILSFVGRCVANTDLIPDHDVHGRIRCVGVDAVAVVSEVPACSEGLLQALASNKRRMIGAVFILSI